MPRTAVFSFACDHEGVAKVYKKIADDNAAALRLQAELSVALCFDVSVQNGGLKQSGVARVKEALLFTTLTM